MSEIATDAITTHLMNRLNQASALSLVSYIVVIDALDAAVEDASLKEQAGSLLDVKQVGAEAMELCENGLAMIQAYQETVVSAAEYREPLAVYSRLLGLIHASFARFAIATSVEELAWDRLLPAGEARRLLRSLGYDREGLSAMSGRPLDHVPVF
jgi:hypothetical protein